MELADRIRSARLEADLSREDVASALGLSMATVVRMETGRKKTVSVQTLMALSALTEQPLSYFLGEVA